MLGRADHGFVDIKAMALNAAISGSILALPDACFVPDPNQSASPVRLVVPVLSLLLAGDDCIERRSV
jgi:hypothetical protein